VSLDPRARLGLVFCAGVMAITLERPAALAAFVVVCALPLATARVDRRLLLSGLGAAAAVVWSTTISQGLFYAEQPRVSLGHLGPIHVYREGLFYGLAQSMRFVGLTFAGVALAVTTPPDRLYAALLRLRVPFGLALMAATALRFVPAIAREALAVRRARAHRGRPTWRRGPIAWLRLELSLLRPVVARSWRRAQNLAESMDARGFDPLAPRTERRPLKLRWWDVAALTIAGGVSIAALGARLLYVLYTSDALYFPSFRPLYGFVRFWL